MGETLSAGLRNALRVAAVLGESQIRGIPGRAAAAYPSQRFRFGQRGLESPQSGVLMAFVARDRSFLRQLP
jgi:hypothetical protein